MSSALAPGDVVRVAGSNGGREPLVVLDPLEAFLDEHGLGSGPVLIQPIGDGHSNVTLLVLRGELRLVLRRPPRGPLPPSAHDVLREARLLLALRPAGVRVPNVLAVGKDATIIGAPFYVLSLVEGHVLTETLPAAIDLPNVRERIGPELVDALVEIHAVDIAAAGLADFGRPHGYLARQVRRFRGMLELTATRPLPELERVADWLEANLPQSPPTAVVHGDYRLGNTMLDVCDGVPRIAAVLDWELAALGDPLADLGYLTAMWAGAGDPENPMLALSAVTRLPGFVSARALASRYAERTGLPLDALPWYQVLATWKSAIFLEASYKRFLAGTTDDGYFARLGAGVPKLARLALARAAAA